MKIKLDQVHFKKVDLSSLILTISYCKIMSGFDCMHIVD